MASLPIPIWSVVGFAVWTLLLLISTVGVHRWSRILTGRAQMRDFRADQVEGPDGYQRAMRAHANCVENLPVFAVLIVAHHIAGTLTSAVTAMSVAVLVARIAQSLIHVGFPQTNRMVLARFTCFSVQLGCFFGLAVALVV